MKKISKLLLFAILFSIAISCEYDDTATKGADFLVEEQSFTIEATAGADSHVGKVLVKKGTKETDLTYTIIKGNVDNVFAISTQEGEITVRNPKGLDYATNPNFYLTVEIKTKRAIVTTTITIEVVRAILVICRPRLHNMPILRTEALWGETLLFLS